MPSRSRSILDQIAQLKRALEGFSFDELSISEANALKKSFESFRVNLEDSVWGNPLENIKSELFTIRDCSSNSDETKSHIPEIHKQNSTLESIRDFIDRVNPLVTNSLEKENLMAISKFIENLRRNGKGNEMLNDSELLGQNQGSLNHSFKPRQIIDQVRFLSNLLITSEEIRLDFFVDKQLPELLNGNPSQFYELLMKLISSRISHLNLGNLKISIYPENKVENNFLNIKLQEEVSSYNLDSGNRENYHSTSDLLDLSRLVEKYNGKFWIGSDTHECSTIHIQIPVLLSELKDSKIAVDSPLKGNKVLVLVGKDEPAKRLIPKLQQWGATTVMDTSTYEGLKRLNKERFDFVILSQDLSGIDAFQACMRIRNSNLANAPAIPIVALSNKLTYNQLDSIRRVGINAVIFRSDSPVIWLKKLLEAGNAVSHSESKSRLEKQTYLKLNILESVFRYNESNRKELKAQIWKFRSDLISALGALKVHLTLLDYSKIGESLTKMKPILKSLQAHHWLILLEEFQSLNRAEAGVNRMRQLYSEMLEEYHMWDYEMERYLQKIIQGINE